MTCVLIRSWPCEDRHAHEKRHVEMEGWCDAASSQGTPRIAGNPRS